MYDTTTMTKLVVVPKLLRVYKKYAQAATHLSVFPGPSVTGFQSTQMPVYYNRFNTRLRKKPRKKVRLLSKK